MKKFTLLAAVAMVVGTAFAQNEPEEINNLKISTGNDFSQYQYYRIRNMRAMRLDYITGKIVNQNGDSIGRDGGLIGMSETLEDGVTPTPQIYDNPYMGLSSLDGNWWLSFANDETIKSPYTEYWYFTWGGRTAPETVYIKNAVISGSVSDTAHKARDLAGYSRSNMDFNTRTGNRYYVLPVKPAFEEVSTAGDNGINWVDSILKSITEEELNSAFALCLNEALTADGNDCLDMNNYINVTRYPFVVDENGDNVTDDNGNDRHYRYGFAGVDRTWSPIRSNGVNTNHWVNNGSIFFVEPADTQDALAAIEAYQAEIQKILAQGAVESAKSHFTEAGDLVKGWMNVTAIWPAEVQAQLQAIVTYCESWNGEGLDSSKITDTDTREAYIAEAQAIASQKLNEAARLVGTGCVVRFENQLAIRDLDTYINGTPDPLLHLGNAYLTSGGNITYRESGTIEEIYGVPELEGRGLVPDIEEENPANEWELQLIPGTYKFCLYNAENNCWIRRYHDMYDFCYGDEILPEGVNEISWATTTDQSEAAPFYFVGCADPDAQDEPNEDEMLLIGYHDGLDFSVENKVRLVSNYTVTSTNAVGAPVTTEYTHNIHRGSNQSDYKFINWTYTRNNWYADSNAFRVRSVQQGGINEVGADNAVKSTGIYDLQGRRVNKAEKGIYIVNGVKTFVR